MLCATAVARFVMEDSKCMICKQDCPRVFFTRYMGDYTEGLAPDEFEDLPVSTAQQRWQWLCSSSNSSSSRQPSSGAHSIEALAVVVQQQRQPQRAAHDGFVPQQRSVALLSAPVPAAIGTC
jgi:hypothetical protein